jgi:putative ABC transport system permease protein
MLVLRQGMMLAIAGVIVGVLMAVAVGHWVSSLLFGVTGRDPLTLGFVSVILTMVALLACYIPARRAARVDPLVALRDE